MRRRFFVEEFAGERAMMSGETAKRVLGGAWRRRRGVGGGEWGGGVRAGGALGGGGGGGQAKAWPYVEGLRILLSERGGSAGLKMVLGRAGVSEKERETSGL